MPPPSKKRRIVTSAVEEVSWDPSARQEYLTGFHKRKLQRAKHAQELAAKKAREEKLEERKKMREERKADLERHVAEVNAMLLPVKDPAIDEFDDSESEVESNDAPIIAPPPIDHEAEYIDEEKYTTVTVEAMNVSREGLHKLEEDKDGDTVLSPETAVEVDEGRGVEKRKSGEKRKWTKERPKDLPHKPKHKKKKFRYENKTERKLNRTKQRAKNSKQAQARKAA